MFTSWKQTPPYLFERQVCYKLWCRNVRGNGGRGHRQAPCASSGAPAAGSGSLSSLTPEEEQLPTPGPGNDAVASCVDSGLPWVLVVTPPPAPAHRGQHQARPTLLPFDLRSAPQGQVFRSSHRREPAMGRADPTQGWNGAATQRVPLAGQARGASALLPGHAGLVPPLLRAACEQGAGTPFTLGRDQLSHKEARRWLNPAAGT